MLLAGAGTSYLLLLSLSRRLVSGKERNHHHHTPVHGDAGTGELSILLLLKPALPIGLTYTKRYDQMVQSLVEVVLILSIFV